MLSMFFTDIVKQIFKYANFFTTKPFGLATVEFLSVILILRKPNITHVNHVYTLINPNVCIRSPNNTAEFTSCFYLLLLYF